MQIRAYKLSCHKEGRHTQEIHQQPYEEIKFD